MCFSGTGRYSHRPNRIFNPTAQARRFDPDGAYVRRYVQELTNLTDGRVDEPWKLDRSTLARSARAKPTLAPSAGGRPVREPPSSRHNLPHSDAGSPRHPQEPPPQRTLAWLNSHHRLLAAPLRRRTCVSEYPPRALRLGGGDSLRCRGSRPGHDTLGLAAPFPKPPTCPGTARRLAVYSRGVSSAAGGACPVTRYSDMGCVLQRAVGASTGRGLEAAGWNLHAAGRIRWRMTVASCL